jgi:hypothetical protein
MSRALLPNHQALPFQKTNVIHSQQHALSIALFANYLILDTILCAIPRFLVVCLLQELSSDLCTPPTSSPSFPYSSQNSQYLSLANTNLNELPSQPPLPSIFSSWGLGDDRSPKGCYRMVGLVQLTMAAGVVAATLLQFVGALAVREYAKALWLREMREESRAITTIGRISVCDERGLPVILEGEEIVGREDEKR